MTQLIQRRRPEKNIADFGAVCDDTADDTAAVQAAALSGVRVTFHDGQRCRITAAVTAWADHTLFEGSFTDGAGGVRLETAVGTLDVFTVTGRDDVHIQGMRIDAGRSVAHTLGSSVRMVGCANSSAFGNRFVQPCSDTVLVRDACDNVTVAANFFDLQGAGTAHVYFLTDNTNCAAIGNVFHDSVGGCIWLSGNVLHTTIQNNRCEASTYELIGIRYDCAYGEVSGNVAVGTGDNGISVTGRGFRVFGNECRENDHAGIGIYGSDNVVTGNECRDNGKAGGSQHPGILLAANFGGLAADNVVSGNVIYRRDGAADEQYYGIRLSNTSYTAWAAGQAITVGLFRTNGNRLYVATTAGVTGATDPTHTAGDVSDGGVTWRYLDTFTNQFARPAGNVVGKNKIRGHAGGDVVRFGSSVNSFADEAQHVVTYAVQPWATGETVEVGYVRTNTVSNIPRRYRAVSPGVTGATAPTHVAGSASDGAVSWYYIGEGSLNDVLVHTEAIALLKTMLQLQCMDSTSDALAPKLFASTVTPEGAVRAANGSVCMRSNATYGIGLYSKTGTTDTNIGWLPVALRIAGVTGNRPAGLTAAQQGLTFFDTSLGKPVWWSGAAWVDATGAAA